MDSFSRAWEYCPNCKQPYTDEALCRQLAEAFVESTENCPDSHYVRFLSRFNRAILLKEQKRLEEALDEFSYLLDVLKSNDAGLSLNGKHMYGYHAQEYIMFTLEFRINTILGSIYENKKNFPKALEYFNTCMSQVNDSSASHVGFKEQREYIEDETKRVKFKMETVDDESAELAWEVESARRNLEREIQLCRLSGGTSKVENDRRILDSKMELAIHLMNDCQFLESLKLFKEGVEYFQRVLGPEHRNTITAKNLQARTKAMYLQHLKKT